MLCQRPSANSAMRKASQLGRAIARAYRFGVRGRCWEPRSAEHTDANTSGIAPDVSIRRSLSMPIQHLHVHGELQLRKGDQPEPEPRDECGFRNTAIVLMIAVKLHVDHEQRPLGRVR